MVVNEENKTPEAMTVLDVNSLKNDVKAAPAWREKGRNSKMIHQGERVNVVLHGLTAGAELKTHSAPGCIQVQVLEGKMEFTGGGRTVTLTPGMIMALADREPHSVKAVEDTVFMLNIFRT